MKTKSNKPILGVVALLSLLIMAAALAVSNPGVTVVSGCVFFATLIVAISRFIDGCENSIINDCL